MSVDVQGVRICPSVLKFSDVELGQALSISVSVKNISRESKKIRFYGPQQKVRSVSLTYFNIFV